MAVGWYRGGLWRQLVARCATWSLFCQLDCGHLRSRFHFCLDCTVTFAPNLHPHFGQGICRRQQSRRFPMQLYCRVPKTKEAAPPQVMVLTLPLFSRICECLVPYFDSTSSESRNVFVLWLHLVASPSILWLCLVSPVLPELCILMMALSLMNFYLERLCYVFLCFYVFYVFFLLDSWIGLKHFRSKGSLKGGFLIKCLAGDPETFLNTLAQLD